MTPFSDDLAAHVGAYANTAPCNERVHREFTEAVAADPLLNAHRLYVEQHKLGYGDAAFHALWKLLLRAAHQRFGGVDALEIGVYKGQVISLWAVLAANHGWPVRVHAVSPLEGQRLPGARVWRWMKYRLAPRFRERVDSGSFYPDDDYEGAIRGLYAHFGLDFQGLRLVRGYSNSPEVLVALRNERFHIIYIDGDHTYEGASGDIRSFAPKVEPGGWLVMDDAGSDLPGATFWKGYETVTRACALLPGLGFTNVLNVGHNRVFEKAR